MATPHMRRPTHIEAGVSHRLFLVADLHLPRLCPGGEGERGTASAATGEKDEDLFTQGRANDRQGTQLQVAHALFLLESLAQKPARGCGKAGGGPHARKRQQSDREGHLNTYPGKGSLLQSFDTPDFFTAVIVCRKKASTLSLSTLSSPAAEKHSMENFLRSSEYGVSCC